MRTIQWLGLPLFAALVAVGLSCAPIEPSPDGEGSPEGKPDAVAYPVFDSPLEDKTKPLPEVPQSLQKRLEAAVNNIRARNLTFNNGFWTIFHGILGLGPGLELVDPKTKERVKALDHISQGHTLKGLVFKPKLKGVLGVEVVSTQDGLGQGHQDQFIAEMAQWSMPADRKFRIDDKEYTFLDFVNFSQGNASVNKSQELSWTIIVVGQYKGLDVEWKNLAGEKLHFDDIVRYELNQSVENAACGGTHRLFGLSWVYHMHLGKGGKAEGVWQGVADKTAKYRELAKKFQNPDGTFSTNFFKGPGNDKDKNLRINTTGHILEWLALALSDEELRQPWVQEAVSALCLQILDLQGAAIDGGGMYHAVHGLLIYYARVFDRKFCPPELMVPLPPGWKKV
ncbi:MAG: hypothetical protein U0797_28355 [Gemmataceae bacterium]